MIEPIPQQAGDAAPPPPCLRTPCVVARSAADVRLAASVERPFALLSARGAAGFAGCLTWLAIAREARGAHPGLIRADILDCADAPGRALEALRLGQRALVLDADAPGFADVRERAAALGATVLASRPPCFDWRCLDRGLARTLTPHLRARLGAFLDAHAHASGP